MNTERTMDPLARRPETWKLEQWLKDTKYDVGSVKTVFDLGSCDLIESVELLRLFPEAKVVAVEANPACFKQCDDKYLSLPKELQDRITMLPYAVNEWTGRCRFWAIDPDKTKTSWIGGNLGASSLLKANGSYEFEEYHQNQILVDCMTLEDMIYRYAPFGKIAIWADLQGAELLALKSAGAEMRRVDLLYTEVSYKAAYENQCMVNDLGKWMHAHGYTCAASWGGQWQGDDLYVAE